MRATFFGLEMARMALQAHQRATDVAGHNIANANTRGYSRQVLQLSANAPYTLPDLTRPNQVGQVGTGVSMMAIQRVRDEFLDLQARNELGRLGRWEARRDALEQVEVIFLEPSDVGLRSVLDRFWGAFQDLAANPESTAVRTAVLNAGRALAESVSHVHAQLSALRENLNSSIITRTAEVNRLAVEIASINRQVQAAVAAGDQPNDLYDRRGVLLEELARFVDAQAVPDASGAVSVVVGGVPLVDGTRAHGLEAVPNPANANLADLVWTSTGTPAQIRQGGLAGLLELRDQVLPSYLAGLEAITGAVVTEVNALHRAGFGLDGSTGLDFFDPASTAATLRLDPALASAPEKVAASASGAPGDGSNALVIADLRLAAVLAGGTIDDYYRGLVGGLGVQTQEAARLADTTEALLLQIDQRRGAVSGVSLDEEMAGLIRSQHAYNAAAKLIAVLNQMLDTVINDLIR